MFKTLDIDRKTIEQKYHKLDGTFDPRNHKNFHGYDFDETTGLDDEDIDKGLAKLYEELKDEPHPIIKSKMVEFVLKNTRIDINEHDYFIGLYATNRPVTKYTVVPWLDELYNANPEANKIWDDWSEAGVAYGWPDFEHTIPDWDSILTLGIPGILKRVEGHYEDLKNSGELTEKQEIYFFSMKREYEAFVEFIDRLYQYSLTKNFEKAPKISECLKHLRDGAPTNSYEAMQLMYIYFMVADDIEHCQTRSLGYGLDASLYPFFKKDIENGTYTKEEIAELLGYFMMQWSAIGNYFGQPMYLGGQNVDGTTKVNELSYLILDVYDKLALFNPKVQIRVSKSTPKDFILKILDMIRRGLNPFVFCNDDMIIKLLMSYGATYEEAVDYAISGCYEFKIKGKGIGISHSYLNGLKPISYVFDNGFDTVTNKQIGLQTGELSQYDTFEKFYAAYIKQFNYIFNKCVDAMYDLEVNVADANPLILFSGTVEETSKTMTDAIDCGMDNFSVIVFSAVGSATDALMAVYELVYEKKETSLEEFKKALDANWEGYEDLHKKALSCKHKYGNGDTIADYYAAAIVQAAYNLGAGRINSHGGKYMLDIHSAEGFKIHGAATKATPDGRYFGDETSKNASPVAGMDRKGVTALIKSATTINTGLCRGCFNLDVMLHPSAVQGEDGLEAFYSVLMTYMNKGGVSAHFNVFDANILRDAQEHPEKYQNLQVRVVGWTTQWTTMSKKEQEAYILRAENIQQ